MKDINIKGILLTIIGAACWGLSGSVGQYLFDVQGMDSRWLVPIRLGVSGILILTYCFIKYGKTTLVPGFNSADSVCVETGRGEYVLYHGNLSVKENEEAAKWLIENVFAELDLHCIVAGLNPSDKLLKLAEKHSNVTLVANPDDAEMIDLLRHAQVNILVTNQPTGLKLKLLNALYNGRFCLVNADMVRGTSLESLCIVADEPEQMVSEIKHLMVEDFTEEDIEERDDQMRQLYDNEANARKIVEAISF